MNEMITMSINLHLLIIVAAILLALYNIYASYKIENEITYINRMKYIQPQYLMIISAIVFTGVTVMAASYFNLRISLVIMIIAISWMFYTSIKKHIIRKDTNTNDKESMQQFREFVKKKYTIDITLMLVVSMASFALR